MKRRTAAEKKRADDARLLRWWKAWHREQRDEALAKCPCLAELFRVFRNLEHAQPVQVLGLASSIDWSVIDYATKLTVVHEFNSCITKLRTKCDLGPIDDPLPGERDDQPHWPRWIALCRRDARDSRQVRSASLKRFCFPLRRRAPTGAQPGLNKPHRANKEFSHECANTTARWRNSCGPVGQ